MYKRQPNTLQTPRDLGPDEDIDPDSDSWHLRMAALSNVTKTAAHFNSTEVKAAPAMASLVPPCSPPKSY